MSFDPWIFLSSISLRTYFSVQRSLRDIRIHLSCSRVRVFCGMSSAPSASRCSPLQFLRSLFRPIEIKFLPEFAFFLFFFFFFHPESDSLWYGDSSLRHSRLSPIHFLDVVSVLSVCSYASSLEIFWFLICFSVKVIDWSFSLSSKSRSISHSSLTSSL